QRPLAEQVALAQAGEAPKDRGSASSVHLGRCLAAVGAFRGVGTGCALAGPLVTLLARLACVVRLVLAGGRLARLACVACLALAGARPLGARRGRSRRGRSRGAGGACA